MSLKDDIKNTFIDWLLLILAIAFLVYISFMSMAEHKPCRYYGLDSIGYGVATECLK